MNQILFRSIYHEMLIAKITEVNQRKNPVMFRRFSVNFALFSIALDALAVCATLAVSTQLRPYLVFLPFAAEYPQVIPLPWVIYPFFAFEWIVIMGLTSVYDGKRNLDWGSELRCLTLGAIIAAMVMAGTLYFSFRIVSRLLFISFIFLAYLTCLGWRMIIRAIWRKRFNRERRVLIVGTGEVGQALYQQILANPNAKLSVIGFVDNQPAAADLKAPRLGSLEEMTSLVNFHKPDDVVIALPDPDYASAEKVIIDLHRQPVKVWLIPDYFRLALHKAAVEEFAGIPMLDMRAPALSDQQRLAKRAFDMLVALLSLPPALILMGIVALLIRIEGSGPVLFTQQRVGENGRLFNIIKFRTMLPGAENLQPNVEQSEPQGNLSHKQTDDPRITKIGKFLRRTSLDEIPQIFNVLLGQMSLVGPRPELPYLVDRYETWQRQRFSVPQGITGWWQVNGRSSRPMHMHTEDDLYYIQHYSLFLDMYILLKTISVVIQGKGAF